MKKRERFRPLVLPLLLLLTSTAVSAANFSTGRPSTTNNDDSCDIAVLPAASLLLPLFEVQISAPVSVARTTLFTVVNTSRQPQIARVTIWTDLGYPVMNFNTFLTGYDVQAFNMYDLIVRGIIAPPNGTNSGTTPGARSGTANPNFLAGATEACGRDRQPVGIPGQILTDVQAALTTGRYSLCGDARVGNTHAHAVGYVTVDLVATCSGKRPIDDGYFAELLYDNVLTGDYEHISPNPATGNYAGGNPLVHIRAVPEGGAAGVLADTSLPYTFYDRLTPAATRRIDRRQPLPSAFATRFIQGGPTAFDTSLQIWREVTTGAGAQCSSYTTNNMQMIEVVRFDERENPTTLAAPIILPPLPPGPSLPAASIISSASAEFPPMTGSDVAGWLYLNLSNGGSTSYSVASGRDFRTGSSTTIGPRQSQNWVSYNMFAEGRYSAMMDATMLANGCTPSPVVTNSGPNPIGPGPNDTP